MAELEVDGGEGVYGRAEFVAEGVPGAGHDGEALAVEPRLAGAVGLAEVCEDVKVGAVNECRAREYEGGGCKAVTRDLLMRGVMNSSASIHLPSEVSTDREELRRTGTRQSTTLPEPSAELSQTRKWSYAQGLLSRHAQGSQKTRWKDQASMESVGSAIWKSLEAVSYTHLTLPTKA